MSDLYFYPDPYLIKLTQFVLVRGSESIIEVETNVDLTRKWYSEMPRLRVGDNIDFNCLVVTEPVYDSSKL